MASDTLACQTPLRWPTPRRALLCFFRSSLFPLPPSLSSVFAITLLALGDFPFPGTTVFFGWRLRELLFESSCIYRGSRLRPWCSLRVGLDPHPWTPATPCRDQSRPRASSAAGHLATRHLSALTPPKCLWHTNCCLIDGRTCFWPSLIARRRFIPTWLAGWG